MAHSDTGVPEDPPPGDAHDTRLRRLRMRSWRRGTKEMDLILGPWADAHLSDLTPEDLDRYEALLIENDQDLYRWISGQDVAPEPHVELIFQIRRMKGYI